LSISLISALVALVALIGVWRPSKVVSGIVVMLLLATTITFEHQRQEEKAAAIRALKQEVSPAQYLTLSAIARQSKYGREEVRRVLADGHVIWSEYSPIEQTIAARLHYEARDEAIRATGLDPKALARADQARNDTVAVAQPSKR
jgi:hypothetical protein